MRQVVDLTLAVNYLPACACLGKILIFSMVIVLIPPGEETKGFVPLAAVLYMDRLITRNIIFDASAILMAVFFANVHAAIQATATRHAYQLFLWGLHTCWAMTCLLLIAEPPQAKRLTTLMANKVVPVAMMLVIVVATAYVQSPLEPGVVRACRAVAFTLLSFAWIYVVGIHSPHGIEYLKETSCQFVARLAPVLYSPLWLIAVFSPAVVGALVFQHTARRQTGMLVPCQQVSVMGGYHASYGPHRDHGVGGCDDSCGAPPCTPGPPSAVAEVSEDDTDQLQELFRMAKMSRGRAYSGIPTSTGGTGGLLETVPE
jgi:hypothetical protein